VKVKELGFEKKEIKASFSPYEAFVLGTGLKNLLILRWKQVSDKGTDRIVELPLFNEV
jgi:hypothetical protein